jgi:beta-phosphoglucomutase
MPEFDAILFDFDGVLIDSEPVHCACWAEVLAPMGVTLDWDFYRTKCIGIDDREMLQMMATQSNPPCDWQTLWTGYGAKKRLFRSRMVDNPPFPPEIGRLLVSSSGLDEIEPLMEAAGLRGYFETVVGGNEVKRLKPAPEPYLLAVERLGVTTALVIEDSAAGAEAGRAAGFEVIRVTHPDDVAGLVLRRLGAPPL